MVQRKNEAWVSLNLTQLFGPCCRNLCITSQIHKKEVAMYSSGFFSTLWWKHDAPGSDIVE